MLEVTDAFVVLFLEDRDCPGTLQISFEVQFYVVWSHFSTRLHVSFFLQIEISVQLAPLWQYIALEQFMPFVFCDAKYYRGYEIGATAD